MIVDDRWRLDELVHLMVFGGDRKTSRPEDIERVIRSAFVEEKPTRDTVVGVYNFNGEEHQVPYGLEGISVFTLRGEQPYRYALEAHLTAAGLDFYPAYSTSPVWMDRGKLKLGERNVWIDMRLELATDGPSTTHTTRKQWTAALLDIQTNWLPSGMPLWPFVDTSFND